MPYSSIYSSFPTETERQTLKEGCFFKSLKRFQTTGLMLYGPCYLFRGDTKQGLRWGVRSFDLTNCK